jgi:hypothetical protein
MTISEDTKCKIIKHIEKMIKDKLQKYEPETKYSPFINALIRDKKRVDAYSFIHSLQTSLGMSVYEQVSKIIVESKGNICNTQWKSPEKIAKSRLEKIDEIITEIGNGDRKSNRKKEQKEILDIPNTNLITKTKKKDGQTVDVYINDRGQESYFDIKTVKPNKSGFLAHKRLILTWIARANKPIKSAIVFPYNPYHPEKYCRVGFTQLGKDDVFIGKEYWDMIGGKGCYEQVVDAFDNAGTAQWKKIKEKLDSL